MTAIAALQQLSTTLDMVERLTIGLGSFLVCVVGVMIYLERKKWKRRRG